MIVEEIKSHQEARDRRYAALDKHKDAVASLQFESMVVIARIVGEWESGGLKPSEGLIKVGLAKAKHKRLMNKLLEEP